MWYTEDFHSGLLTLLNGLRNFFSLFTSVSRTVSNSLVQNLTDFTSSSATLATFGTGSPFQSQTDALAQASTEALNFARTIGTLLNATTDALLSDFTFTNDGTPVSSTSKVDLNTAADATPRSSYILMGVVLAWLIIQMVLLIGNKCISRIFKACSCLTLASAVLVGLLAAVFYIPALVGSDICVAPDTTITNIFNTSSDSTNANTLAIADTWSYYSQCRSNPSFAPVGVYGNLLNATQQLTDAYTLVQSINTSVYGNPTYDTWLPYLMNISDSVVLANVTLTTILTDTACGPVNAIYTDMVTGLCNGATVGFITAFFATVASLGVFLLLLSFTACLIFHHPGDLSGNDDGNGSTRYDDLYEEVALNRNKNKNQLSKMTNYGTTGGKDGLPVTGPTVGRATRVGNMTGAGGYNSSSSGDTNGRNWR